MILKTEKKSPAKKTRFPRCIVIAGPNGAGKTTFAREYLPREGGILHFVNADLIAGGLSPLRPELAAVGAASVLRRFARGMENFKSIYGPLADSWDLYDNSGTFPKLVEKKP